MSGPKDYMPPPSYSMKVFNGRLNELFQLQAQLGRIVQELNQACVADFERSIYFDCKEQLGSIQKSLDIVLQPLVFDYRGRFGQATYNLVENEINGKVAEVRKLMSKCQNIQADFAKKKADYSAYLNYQVFYSSTKSSYENFKSGLIHYFKTHLEKQNEQAFAEAQQRISAVAFTMELAPFHFGFQGGVEREKQAIVGHVQQKEALISSIRTEISDKVIDLLEKSASSGAIKKEASAQHSKEIKSIIEKINKIITACEVPSLKEQYTFQLKQLSESAALKDSYYFKELHDSLYEAEKLRRAKIGIQDLLAELNAAMLHSSVLEESQTLKQTFLRMLNSSSIRSGELEDAASKLSQLTKRSAAAYDEESVRQKERLFLKTQIVHSLENMGYEVMDDLQVIDFETCDDLLLKIKNQENYLNLKFKDDGSFRYVFQIPENVEQLSTDAQKVKLHEMQTTCDEFSSVLEDLAQMGLNVDIRSHRPVDVSSIVSVPANKRDKIKKMNKGTQSKQIRAKYIN